MDKKKKLIIIISSICLVIIALVLYIFVFNKQSNTSNYAYKRALRYYVYKDNQYHEYKYECKKSNCSSKEIEKDLYLLNDDKKYLYTPVDDKKITVDFDDDNIYETILDNDNKPYALVFKEPGEEDFESPKYIYIIKDNQTYLKGDGYTSISFPYYEYYEGEGEDEKYATRIIDYNYLIVSNKNNDLYVIDYKENKKIFDSTKLDFKAEDNDYDDKSHESIKVDNDKYFHLIKCPNGISYLLNEKYNSITSYSSKGQMGQFGAGDQILVYNKKIFVINNDDKSYSVYDTNGKLVRKSSTFNYVYSLANGYILVNKTIDDKKVDIVIDENEKELFRIPDDNTGSDLETVLYYNKENNSLIVDYIGGLDSGTYYKYDLKTKQLTKKIYTPSDEY